MMVASRDGKTINSSRPQEEVGAKKRGRSADVSEAGNCSRRASKGAVGNRSSVRPLEVAGVCNNGTPGVVAGFSTGQQGWHKLNMIAVADKE